MGMGIKGISATFELSRNTVGKYVRLFQESSIPMEQLLSMPANRLQEMFGSGGERVRSLSGRQLEPEALLPEYAARLTCKGVTVMRTSYVTQNKHHYSVPQEYIGKRVDIVYDADTLDIFHGLRLVTTHHRDDTPYSYTQKEAHNLPGRYDRS
jgi:hypothetical protein